MADDELGSDAESANVESDEELSEWSDENNNSESLNHGEDSNAKSSDDEIDPVVAEALKQLRGAISGYAKTVKKRREASRCRVEKQPVKRTRHDEVRGRGKSVAGDSSRAGSRCNNRDFGNIISALDDHKRKIIRDRGFGTLLEYDGCSVPRGFVQWISDQVDVNCCDILVGGKVVPFSSQSVNLFLGLPIGGEDIIEHHNDSVKSKFLKEINETSLPLVKTFGTKLKGNTLSEDDIFRYFMVVALSTFLCPNSSTLPSPKYLGPLIDLSTVKQWDWSSLVFRWLFSSISYYRKKHRNTIGGCIYFLAGYYLDFLDFGYLHQLPPTLPRIKCWKGLMIKTYASYDRVSANKFGKRPVKSIKHTCYSEENVLTVACDEFTKIMDTHCNFISREDRDCMSKIFEEHHTRLGFTLPGSLVAKIFKYIHHVHVVARRASRASAEAESSSTRVSPAANDDVDDAVPDEHDGPVPSPVHGFVPEGVLDAGGLAGPSNTNVKEADAAAGIDKFVTDVQSNNACPTKSREEEASVTEKIESDGLYDAPANESCGVSQPTEIISCSNSSAHVARNLKRKENASTPSVEVHPSKDSAARHVNRKENPSSPSIEMLSPKDSAAHGARKGKRAENVSSPSIEIVRSKDSRGQGTSNRRRRKNPSQSTSADSIASRTRRGVSKNVGRSPLSRMDGNNDGIGVTADNPLVVDETPMLEASAGARKRQKLNEKEGKTTSAAAAPLMENVYKAPVEASSARKPTDQGASIPCIGKEGQLVGNAAAAPHHNGKEPVDKPCIKKTTPCFNSPSAPSFRLLEDEDDNGNYVEDPKLRRPVGTVFVTTCPVERARSLLERTLSKDKHQEVNSVVKTAHTSSQKRGANTCHGGVSANVQVDTIFFFQFRNAPDGWVFIDRMTHNPFGPSGNVINEETVEPARNDNVQTDYIRMESLPFTDYSENVEEPNEAIPLAAISPTGEDLDITPAEARLPLQHEKSVVGGNSMGSNGFKFNSDSSSEAVWQSSSSKIAVHRPRRVVQPSIYKLSPFVIPHSKIRVSNDEADLYEAVLLMAQSSENKNLAVIDYGLVKVYLSALATSLQPGGNVSYFVVNAFCRLLFLRRHPRDSKKHFFFSKVGDFLIGNHGRDDEKYQELFDSAVKCFRGAHRARPLTKSDYLFFPILFRERWYVVVVYFSRRWCMILDSCTLIFGVDSPFHKAVKDEFLQNMLSVWKEVVNIDYGWLGFTVFHGNVPQQNENTIYDSGVFAMKYLEHFEVNIDVMSKFDEDDIGNLRIKLVNEMVLNDSNCACYGMDKIQEVSASLHEAA